MHDATPSILSRVLLTTLLLSTTASAQELLEPTPILVAVHLGGPASGADGSVWRTVAAVTNTSNQVLPFFGVPCPLAIPACPTFGGIFPGVIHPLGIYGGNPGYLVWVQSRDEARVHISSRLFEEGHNTIPAGVAMPVVRRAEFQSSITIPAVPALSGHRYHLRVYGIPASLSGDAAAYVFRVKTAGGVTLAEEVIQGHAQGILSSPGSLPVFPIVAVADLTGIIAAATGNVSVQVENRDGRDLWGFVSMTAQHTHAVSLALPD